MEAPTLSLNRADHSKSGHRSKSDMRVLFIGLPNSGSRPGKAGLYLPLGLAYLSAALKNQGYKYDCIDLHSELILDKSRSGDLWDYLRHFDLSSYNIVALGGVFLKMNDLTYVSKMIRDSNPDLFQIVGGQMATVMADLILETTKVDCVGLYEGEKTIVKLVKALQEGSDWKQIESIKFRNEEGVIIETPTQAKLGPEDIPKFPDRESWRFDIIRKAFPTGSPGRYSAAVFASRGCPFLCTFCNPQSGKEIRTRNIDDIIFELRHLKEKWNVQYIRFADEVFIGSKKIIRQLCNRMIEEKLDLFWECSTQVRLVDKDLVKLMKEAGCIDIALGIESGSDQMLEEMKKGTTSELSRQAIEMVNEAGLSPSANFLAGFPSETVQTIEQTRDFVVSLNHVQWVSAPQIIFVVPLPDTELFHTAIETGAIENPKKYVLELMSTYTKSTTTAPINLTKIPWEKYNETVQRCNREIKKDFYCKHPVRFLFSTIGLDHLRYDLLFRHFSLRQRIPLFESLAWVMVGKHTHRFESWKKIFNRSKSKLFMKPEENKPHSVNPENLGNHLSSLK